MPKVIAGTGRRRPQINIPITLLDLDSYNPRLAKEHHGSNQMNLLNTLYQEFDLEELAYSMAENGYFDEEPIVVVPESLPANFKLSENTDIAQQQLQELIDQRKIRLTVVEGNRRTATLKLLVDADIRKKIKVSSDFPKATNPVIEDLKIIPAIVYRNRSTISAYLGVRHISGLMKWDAYAKAVYLASRIEEQVKNGSNIEDSIKEVQRQTADRADVIRRQYLCYKVLKEAEEDLNFDSKNLKDRFSLITVALNSPSIREFIGAPSYKTANFSKRIIPIKQLPDLEKLLTWIFGNGDNKQPILTDSRKITSRLAPILADEESKAYLLQYDALEEAYERSGGEKKFLMKKITDSTRNLRNALGIAYKYKTEDVRETLNECLLVANELKTMLQK